MEFELEEKDRRLQELLTQQKEVLAFVIFFFQTIP
jgi:hypothetical protein